MAFDQSNNNPADAGQNQTMPSSANPAVTSGASDVSKEPLSPWDEELPEEETPEQKIGSLAGPSGNTQDATPKEDNGFVVPENIENQTPLNIVDGNNFNNQEVNQTKTEQVAEQPLPNTISTEQPVQEMATAEQQSSSGIPPKPTDSSEQDFDDLDIFGNDLPPAKTIGTDIKPSMSPSVDGTILPMTASDTQSQSTPVLPAQESTGPQASVASDMASPSPLQSVPSMPFPESQSTETAQSLSVSSPVLETNVLTNPVVAPRQNFLTSLLRRKQDNNNGSQQFASSVSAAAVPSQFAEMSKAKLLPKILKAVGGLLVIFLVLIVLTESGITSFGLEKSYNAMGLEVLWGGLPKNAEPALGKALVAMKKKSGFKVAGTLSLGINTAVESEVTTPLVSYGESNRKVAAYDKPEKAILAVTEEEYYIDEDGNVIDPETVNQMIANENSASNSSDSSTADSEQTDDTSSSTADNSDTGTTLDAAQEEQTDQTDETVYGDQQLNNTYDGVEAEEINAEVDGFVSKNGSDINLLIEKTGTSEVNLKNKIGKLWVKSDKIQFNDSAEEGKWLEYNLQSLQDKNLFESFMSADLSSVKIKGEKVGNEKIGKVRCYNYKIDQLEIGDALSEIGIPSNLVQSIEGNIWIGVSDKIIRKIDLKILPSASSAFLAIGVTLEFTGSDNNSVFDEPDSSDVITELSEYIPASQIATEEETQESEDVTSDETSTTSEIENANSLLAQATANDTKRKSDLKSIRDALEAYKAQFSKYPISATTAKLNVSSNILSQKLVPNYISVLPADPLDTSGWYYGYKSTDGKSYYVSAKLENASDPEIRVVDNLNLYFLYNE